MRVADKKLLLLLLLPLVSLLAGVAAAAEKSPFHEGRYERGELKFIHGLPVLVVEGTPRGDRPAEGRPDRRGRQGHRRLSAKTAPHLSLPNAAGRSIVADGRTLFKQAPADHREELQTFAKALAIDADAGHGRQHHHGHLSRLAGLLVADGLGRKERDQGAAVRPKPRLLRRWGSSTTTAWLPSIAPRANMPSSPWGLPGMFGCLSGMNDAGLALAVHEVFLAADGSTWLNLKGMPYTALLPPHPGRVHDRRRGGKTAALRAALDDAQPGGLRPARRAPCWK